MNIAMDGLVELQCGFEKINRIEISRLLLDSNDIDSVIISDVYTSTLHFLNKYCNWVLLLIIH